MIGKEKQITLFQFILMIHSVQMGAGLVSLPGELAKGCGTDGWIVLIIGWIVSMASSLIIIQIMQRYPNGTVIDLLSHYFGKWVGKVGMVLFACYFLLFTFLIYDRVALLMQNWILQQTSTGLLMLLFLFPSYLITKGGFRIIGRYGEIVFFLSISFLSVMLLLLQFAHWIHLLPILKLGWMPILRTVKSTILAFIGFEIAFFLYPYLEKKSAASMGIVIANSITFCIYMLVTLVSYVVLSPDEITQYNNTLVVLLKIIEFRFLERFDIIIFSIYFLIIMRTWMPMMFAAVLCTKQLGIRVPLRMQILILLSIMIGVVWIWNPSWNFSTDLNDFVQAVGIWFSFGLPLILWIVLAGMAKFRRRVS